MQVVFFACAPNSRFLFLAAVSARVCDSVSFPTGRASCSCMSLCTFSSILPFVRGWICHRIIGQEEVELLHCNFNTWSVFHPYVSRQMLRERVELAALERIENEEQDWVAEPRPYPYEFSGHCRFA